MTLASILRSKGGSLVSVEADTPVAAVTEILHRNNIGAVLVMRGGQLAGVLSDRGIVRAMALNPQGVRAMPAERAMRPREHEATPDMPLTEAMRIMTVHRVRYLPVLDDGTLVGIVSIGDLLKAELERQSVAVDSLTAYIGGT
ncbi:MAG: CBS domain-containing protein [Gluconacetobacter diazotrophicus]|nr:CBS domain-containing protein [Gluconacetobacter diazotrophicus]